MKKIASILLTTALVLGIVLSAGCSQKSSDGTAAVPPDSKTYKIAVSGTFPPFGMIGKTGNPEGFEIDLIKAIAAEKGFKAKCEVTSWSSKMPALKSEQVDVLLCSMTITDERKKEVDFSDPYFESTNYMLVPRGSQIHSLADLKGKTVAVLQASTSDFAISDYLGKNYEGLKRYRHTTTAFMEVKNGKVDAAVGDSGIVMYYIKKNPEVNLSIVKGNNFPKEYYGMAVRKGDQELLQLINDGLKKVRENGKYEQIYEKWFKD